MFLHTSRLLFLRAHAVTQILAKQFLCSSNGAMAAMSHVTKVLPHKGHKAFVATQY